MKKERDVQADAHDKEVEALKVFKAKKIMEDREKKKKDKKERQKERKVQEKNDCSKGKNDEDDKSSKETGNLNLSHDSPKNDPSQDSPKK